MPVNEQHDLAVRRCAKKIALVSLAVTIIIFCLGLLLFALYEIEVNVCDHKDCTAAYVILTLCGSGFVAFMCYLYVRGCNHNSLLS